MSGRKRQNRGRGTHSSKRAYLTPISERVKKVGGDKFGILSVDCHKADCACRVTNFYSDILMPTTKFDKTSGSLKKMVRTVEEVMEAHGVLDLAAAVEMSGSHYETVKRVLSKHWTVRMIHPFTTKQLRQPASPGVKTDDADLDAMTRAMISGYSYEEAELPPFYEEWRMFCRNRIDYVEERVQIMQRCMERIEANMPGITTVFKDIWKRKGVLAVVRYLGGARKILDAGEDGIRKMLRERKVKMASSTIFKILAWAENAAEPASQAKTRRRLIRDDFEMIDRHDKKIREYEFELLRFLVKNIALVFIGIPGINVVSASNYACELGPVTHYVNPRKITGAAGIYPCCFQSGEVEEKDGPVAKGHNARLRGALLSISQNLRKHNPFFKGWIASKRARKKVSDEKLDTNIACKFSGISFNMLARREVFSHPQGGKGEPILLKIVKFCKESKVDVEKLDQILKDAIGSLPHRACLGEAQAWEDAIKSNCGAGRSLYYDCQRREKILKLLWERITQEMKEDDHAIAVDK